MTDFHRHEKKEGWKTIGKEGIPVAKIAFSFTLLEHMLALPDDMHIVGYAIKEEVTIIYVTWDKFPCVKRKDAMPEVVLKYKEDRDCNSDGDGYNLPIKVVSINWEQSGNPEKLVWENTAEEDPCSCSNPLTPEEISDLVDTLLPEIERRTGPLAQKISRAELNAELDALKAALQEEADASKAMAVQVLESLEAMKTKLMHSGVQHLDYSTEFASITGIAEALHAQASTFADLTGKADEADNFPPDEEPAPLEGMAFDPKGNPTPAPGNVFGRPDPNPNPYDPAPNQPDNWIGGLDAGDTSFSPDSGPGLKRHKVEYQGPGPVPVPDGAPGPGPRNPNDPTPGPQNPNPSINPRNPNDPDTFGPTAQGPNPFNPAPGNPQNWVGGLNAEPPTAFSPGPGPGVELNPTGEFRGLPPEDS